MQFREGDRVKVKGEKGRAEATVIGMDESSGMYRLRFHAVEARDDKGQKVELNQGTGYAPGEQMTRRR